MSDLSRREFLKTASAAVLVGGCAAQAGDPCGCITRERLLRCPTPGTQTVIPFTVPDPSSAHLARAFQLNGSLNLFEWRGYPPESVRLRNVSWEPGGPLRGEILLEQMRYVPLLDQGGEVTLIPIADARDFTAIDGAVFDDPIEIPVRQVLVTTRAGEGDASPG